MCLNEIWMNTRIPSSSPHKMIFTVVRVKLYSHTNWLHWFLSDRKPPKGPFLVCGISTCTNESIMWRSIHSQEHLDMQGVYPFLWGGLAKLWIERNILMWSHIVMMHASLVKNKILQTLSFNIPSNWGNCYRERERAEQSCLDGATHAYWLKQIALNSLYILKASWYPPYTVVLMIRWCSWRFIYGFQPCSIN